MIVKLIEKTYALLWGDLFTISLGNSSIGISLMILLLVPAGIYFTIRTGFLPIRYFPQMIGTLKEKKESENSLSSLQTLIISTATRVGMGNLVGVVAAVSAGGAGAVFWMWLMALLGASTAYVEASLAQKYKAPDPLYGGYRGGPAYYIHEFFKEKTGKNRRRFLIPALFAISGLICWCGISQVISNSVSSAFQNAFHIPPIVTTVILVFLAAVIVLQKNATIKLLDILVPIMAGSFFAITVFIILLNVHRQLQGWVVLAFFKVDNGFPAYPDQLGQLRLLEIVPLPVFFQFCDQCHAQSPFSSISQNATVRTTSIRISVPIRQ